MKHWYRIIPLAALLALAATPGAADTCPDLRGNWNVTARSAGYDVGPPPALAYVTSTGVLTVHDQSGCLFFAVFQRTDVAEPAQPLTGVIGPAMQITLTGRTTLARGSLVGRSRIETVVSEFAPLGGTINTSLATAIRE